MINESDEVILTKIENEGIKLASINKRLLSFVIDDMIISSIFVIIFYDKFKELSSDLVATMAFVNSIFIYMIIVKTLYQTLFVAMYGQSIGKMFLKIRVIDTQYLDIPTFFESFKRAIGRDVSEMIFYLGFVWANFTPTRQTWHDKFAHTIVVDV